MLQATWVHAGTGEARVRSPTEDAEAVSWAERGADGGDARSQSVLAHFYERGVGGLVRDKAKAAELAKLAAAQGDQPARELLVRLWE